MVDVATARKSTVVSTAYGRNWYDQWAKDPIAIDLVMYASDKLRENTPGAVSKWEHQRKVIKAIYPDSVFTFSRWTDWMGESWCDPGPTSCWGAGGTGKSATFGMLLYIDLLANPRNTVTLIITSPMVKHSDRCFGNVIMWRAKAGKYKVGSERKSQPKGLITAQEGDKNSGVICTSTNPGESAKDIFAKVGTHAKRNRLIVDEPQACSESVLELYLNLGATGEYKEAFLGNPSSWFDALGRHSDPAFPLTRKSVSEDEPDKFVTKREIRGHVGHCIVLDGRRSPVFDEGEDPEKFAEILPEKSHVESALRTRGLDDMWVWNQIIGRIPPGGMVKTIIDQLELETLGMRPEPRWDSPTEQWAAADFAPENGDENVLKRAKVGYSGGKKVCYIAERVSIGDLAADDKLTHLAQSFADQLKMWDIPMNRFGGDGSGEGSTIITKMEEYAAESGAFRCQFGGGASENRVLVVHPEIGKDVYANRATEVAFNLAVFIQQGQMMGISMKTAEELLARGLQEHPTKHLSMLEPKKEFRKRYDYSPDDMDADSVLATMLKEKGILKPGEGSTVNRTRNLKRREVKAKKDTRNSLKRKTNIVYKWNHR